MPSGKKICSGKEEGKKRESKSYTHSCDDFVTFVEKLLKQQRSFKPNLLTVPMSCNLLEVKTDARYLMK